MLLSVCHMRTYTCQDHVGVFDSMELQRQWMEWSERARCWYEISEFFFLLGSVFAGSWEQTHSRTSWH
jgi:hypothetical protein